MFFHLYSYFPHVCFLCAIVAARAHHIADRYEFLSSFSTIRLVVHTQDLIYLAEAPSLNQLSNLKPEHFALMKHVN